MPTEMQTQTLDEFLSSLTGDERIRFADACESSVGYLVHVAKGRRKASSDLAIKIERESLGAVRCEELCPGTDWDYIRNSAA